jgi:hypothetical protein
MNNIISICQPHFIPWVGYFHLINKSSKIVFLDNVQYNKRSWQNRTHIRINQNSDNKKFLSLHVKDNSRQNMINEIYLKEENIELFLNNIKNTYLKSPYFERYYEIFKDLFNRNIGENLANFNLILIKEICKFLDIKLTYYITSNYNFMNKKEYLILEILKYYKADTYLSNVGSKRYVKDEFFIKNDIKIIYNEFKHPTYNQNLKKENIFIENLSIFDLLVNEKDPQKFFKY